MMNENAPKNNLDVAKRELALRSLARRDYKTFMKLRLERYKETEMIDGDLVTFLCKYAENI